MSPQRHNSRRGAVGQDHLLTLLLLFFSVIVGVRYGIQWGASLGTPGAIGGGIIGFVAGAVFTILTRLLAAMISRPFEVFGRWWRPYPPPCENGTCTSPDRHHLERLPDEAGRERPDLAAYGYRCECGNLYARLGETRWVRVLPDSTLQPYLIHRPFGRWRPDRREQLPPYRPSSEPLFFGVLGAVILVLGVAAFFLARLVPAGALTTIGAVGILSGTALLLLAGLARLFRGRESAAQAAEKPGGGRAKVSGPVRGEEEAEIPGWTVPVIVTFLAGGTSLLAMWIETGLKDAISRWLVAGCTVLGLVVSTAWWLGHSWRQRRMAGTGRDPFDAIAFLGVKAVSLFAGVLAIGVWVFTPPGQSTVGNLAVSFITGGLFLAGFFMGGLSLRQNREGRTTGFNRHCPKLALLGLAMLILGFAMAFITLP